MDLSCQHDSGPNCMYILLMQHNTLSVNLVYFVFSLLILTKNFKEEIACNVVGVKFSDPLLTLFGFDLQWFWQEAETESESEPGACNKGNKEAGVAMKTSHTSNEHSRLSQCNAS